MNCKKAAIFSRIFRLFCRIAHAAAAQTNSKTRTRGDEKMNKATMVVTGIITAASVAGAMGVVMSNSAKRVARNTAEAVEKTGKKMRRMVQNMK